MTKTIMYACRSTLKSMSNKNERDLMPLIQLYEFEMEEFVDL